MRRKWLWLVWAVAAALRLYRLGAADFWYDEAFSALVVRLPFADMLRAIAGDVHPPLWYVLMWGWMRFVGAEATHEAILRLPSAVMSLAAIPLVWRLARLWRVPAWVQWGGVVWMAISPAQIHYAQEFRMYALLQAEFLAMLVAFYSRRDRWAALLLYLMLMTHHYAVFYAAAVGVLVALHRRPAWPYAAAVVAWSPWAALLWAQARVIRGHYWIQPFHPVGDPGYTVVRMALGWALPAWAVVLATGILVAAIVVGVWGRPGRAWLWVLVPTALAGAASLLWQPVWLPRAFLPLVPVMALLVTAGWARWPGARWYFSTLLAPFVLLALWGYYGHMASDKGTFSRRVVEFAQQIHPRPGDVFIHTTDATAVGFALYAPQWTSVRLRVCEDPPGALSPLTQSTLFQVVDEIPHASRVWIVHSEFPLTPNCLREQAQRWARAAMDEVVISRESGGQAVAWRMR